MRAPVLTAEQAKSHLQRFENIPWLIRDKAKFCLWKYETDKRGRITKIPYDPKNGYRAKVDRPETFGSYQEARKSFENAIHDGICNYSGIGILPPQGMAAIDVDRCFHEDGTLTEVARAIVALLGDCYMERSPSGKGLRILIQVPEDFVYDKVVYKINNRKCGVEIYLPDTTKHFVTVTGDVFQPGEVSDNVEALQTIMDSMMLRENQIPRNPQGILEWAGESLLTEEEILRIACAGKKGDRFLKLYKGETSDYPSQSEAELAFMNDAAFYSNRDPSMMDALYRSSDLYRPKWDERHGPDTYGNLTIAKAIRSCQDVYDPNYYRQSPEEDFAEVTEPSAAEQLLAITDFSPENLFSPAVLSLAADAYAHNTAAYAIFRSRLVSAKGALRLFEKAMKEQCKKQGSDAIIPVGGGPLQLPSAPMMLVPNCWSVTMQGIIKLENTISGIIPRTVSPAPAYISRKLENVDDGTEKTEITFYRNQSWRKLIAPRAAIMNRNAIIRYADNGLPVQSDNAGYLVSYFADFESANDAHIPIVRCISRAGWIGNEFYPYCTNSTVVYQEEVSDTSRLMKALKVSGEKEAWLAMAMKLRTMPLARGMLAASFASPLLEKLQKRPIYFHNWSDSKGGKTASLKAALSVWGKPGELMGSYCATAVGMERMAGALKHLPMGLDELQSLNQKKVSASEIIYKLGNGIGKMRGTPSGGMQRTEQWRNCILSTGEQPMTTERSMDGESTRIMEFYGKPITDEAFAHQVHQVTEQNYGFAGETYIRYIIEQLLHSGNADSDLGGNRGGKQSGNTLLSDYRKMNTGLSEQIRSNTHSKTGVYVDNCSILALADYYASISVFGLSQNKAYEEAITMGLSLLENLKQQEHSDTVDSAWEFVKAWVAQNKSQIISSTSTMTCLKPIGVIEKGNPCIYVIANVLNCELENAGFSHKKCIKGFLERGYVTTKRDSKGKNRSSVGKRVNGILTRCYCLNVEWNQENTLPGRDFSDDEDFLM